MAEQAKTVIMIRLIAENLGADATACRDAVAVNLSSHNKRTSDWDRGEQAIPDDNQTKGETNENEYFRLVGFCNCELNNDFTIS